LQLALNNSGPSTNSNETSKNMPLPLLRGKSLQALLSEIRISTAHILEQKENADMDALKARLTNAEAENSELLELISRQQDSIHVLEEERAALESRLTQQPNQQEGETAALLQKNNKVLWMKSLQSEIQAGESHGAHVSIYRHNVTIFLI
jgi:hypothetical protein